LASVLAVGDAVAEHGGALAGGDCLASDHLVFAPDHQTKLAQSSAGVVNREALYETSERF
jgi:hypothetical protein